MSTLPLRLPIEQMQQKWKSQLDPLIVNPMNNANLLKNISLVTGVNVINHLLGRQMQGWFIADIQGAAQIYRSAPFNNLTLTLTSDADVTISLGVF